MIIVSEGIEEKKQIFFSETCINESVSQKKYEKEFVKDMMPLSLLFQRVIR